MSSLRRFRSMSYPDILNTARAAVEASYDGGFLSQHNIHTHTGLVGQRPSAGRVSSASTDDTRSIHPH